MNMDADTDEKLAIHAKRVELGSCSTLLISLEDLIAIKRHINRPQDRTALVHLEALQRLSRSGEN